MWTVLEQRAELQETFFYLLKKYTRKIPCAIFISAISLLSLVKGQCSQSGITLTGTSGNVSSPSYPSNYPNRQTCRWIITVPQGHLVRLSFEVFQLETCAVPSPVCSCDHVEVRDGRDGSSKQLGRYCGSDKPSPVQSSGRFMWIEFDTDLTGNEKGFLANFNSIGMYPAFSLYYLHCIACFRLSPWAPQTSYDCC